MPANQKLDLTSTDAAQSVASAPLCLLSVLAAQFHVGLARKTRSTGKLLANSRRRSPESGNAPQAPRASSGACGNIALRRVWALRICRDYSAHGTRRNGIYRWSEYHGSPEYGAPGLRCAGTTVHWYLRLPWRLRCAGTTVRRDYGGPRPTSSAASTHGRPGSPHRSG